VSAGGQGRSASEQPVANRGLPGPLSRKSALEHCRGKEPNDEFCRASSKPFCCFGYRDMKNRASDLSPELVGLSKSVNEALDLREEVLSTSMFEEIVGSSEAITRVAAQVMRVAPSSATVLITGESGTGKELIARAIHKRSQRSVSPFTKLNCAATPPTLIAADLFGYEQGAFTGANQRHAGRFEVANHGSILLDEIGDMPVETQVALLRVLQEREFERVGGTQSVSVDVRVIAATNCDLRAAVRSGKFRPDLFYRLNVFPIHVPPLRERREDILLLTKYFIARYTAKTGKTIRWIDPQTAQILQAYDWPGNIRELQNLVERAMILCDADTFFMERAWLHPAPEPRFGLRPSMTTREREVIEGALAESHGKVAGPNGAARKLGIARTTLESRIKSLGINKHRYGLS
jgi:formate hydrogenlyase transcriptional activator